MLSDDVVRQMRLLRRRVGRSESKAGPLYLEDDGTYVPAYFGGTTPGVTTHTFQSGAWTRVGRLLIVRGQVNWSAATGTGNAQISLPFAPGAGNFTGSLYLSGVTFANSAPEILLSAGNLFFTMGSPLTNAAPTVVQMEAAGSIVFTIAYFL